MNLYEDAALQARAFQDFAFYEIPSNQKQRV